MPFTRRKKDKKRFKEASAVVGVPITGGTAKQVAFVTEGWAPAYCYGKAAESPIGNPCAKKIVRPRAEHAVREPNLAQRKKVVLGHGTEGTTIRRSKLVKKKKTPGLIHLYRVTGVL